MYLLLAQLLQILSISEALLDGEFIRVNPHLSRDNAQKEAGIWLSSKLMCTGFVPFKIQHFCQRLQDMVQPCSFCHQMLILKLGQSKVTLILPALFQILQYLVQTCHGRPNNILLEVGLRGCHDNSKTAFYPCSRVPLRNAPLFKMTRYEGKKLSLVTDFILEINQSSIKSSSWISFAKL